jgi:hypothetical protein
VLHVHHHVHEVEQDPAGLGHTLAANRLDALLTKPFLDLVDDRLHLPLVRRRGEHEGIGDRQPVADVDDRHVGGEFVRSRLRGEQRGVPRLGRGGHRGTSWRLVVGGWGPSPPVEAGGRS